MFSNIEEWQVQLDALSRDHQGEVAEDCGLLPWCRCSRGTSGMSRARVLTPNPRTGIRDKVRNLVANWVSLEDTGPDPMDVGVQQGEYEEGGVEEYLGAVGKGSRERWVCSEQGQFSKECVTKGGKKGMGKGQKGKGPTAPGKGTGPPKGAGVQTSGGKGPERGHLPIPRPLKPLWILEALPGRMPVGGLDICRRPCGGHRRVRGMWSIGEMGRLDSDDTSVKKRHAPLAGEGAGEGGSEEGVGSHRDGSRNSCGAGCQRRSVPGTGHERRCKEGKRVGGASVVGRGPDPCSTIPRTTSNGQALFVRRRECGAHQRVDQRSMLPPSEVRGASGAHGGARGGGGGEREKQKQTNRDLRGSDVGLAPAGRSDFPQNSLSAVPVCPVWATVGEGEMSTQPA